MIKRPGTGDTSHAPQPSPRQLFVSHNLAIDLVTIEVTQSLGEAGVGTIVLKGPVLARWLYDDGALRVYADSDLLIAPDDFPAAEQVLRKLGFKRSLDELIPGDRPEYAVEWTRDGAHVELHRSMEGIEAAPAVVWETLREHTESMILRGAEVNVLDPPARALQVALHAAQHGPPVPKPQEDLERALQKVPDDVWLEAARLASRLEATPAFAAGLRLHPAGDALAARLRLPANDSIEVALRTAGAHSGALELDWLASTPGLARKAILVLRKLVPPPAFMRVWSPLARRGRVGLVIAYLWRPLWVLRHTAPALCVWLRARKEVSGQRREAPDGGEPGPLGTKDGNRHRRDRGDGI